MRKYTIVPLITYDSLLLVWRRLQRRATVNRYLHHNILLLCSNILTGIFAYLLHPLLGHLMGIQVYGQIAALISLSLVLATPMLIIETIAAKYASSLSINEDHSKLNDFIRYLTVRLLFASIGMTVIVVATSSYIASFFHLASPQEVLLLALIFIVSFLTPLNLGALQGLQYFGWFATVTMLSTFLRLVFSISFVLMGLGITGAILGIVASTLLVYLISLLPLRKVLRGPRTPVGSLRSLWSYSILAVVATGGLVILYSTDTVLARHFLSDRDAGLYAALATIGRTVLFITSSVGTIMFPMVASLNARKKPHLDIAKRAILSVLLLSSTVELIFYLTPSFITKLLFGQAFMAISGQLVPYGMAMLLLATGQILIMYFLATGHRSFVVIIFLACILQISLIIWHHATITQLVQAVIITNTALVLALLSVFATGSRRLPLPVDEILLSQQQTTIIP